MRTVYFSTIGEDSHRIDDGNLTEKALILGGTVFDVPYACLANSDGDVVLHALTNAISGATTVNILGKVADDMCKRGIKDSTSYLEKAMSYLGTTRIEHVSISIRAKRPKFAPYINQMRQNIADILKIAPECVGITATTDEELSDFGKGLGISVTSIISFSKEVF